MIFNVSLFQDGVLLLYYSIFKEPLKVPKITITEIKEEPGLKTEEKKPQTYFGDCCDHELPHDLSPLELIATVANGLSSLPEGRGQKRDAEMAELYDDDAPSSNETQIQKSIEHAIEVCSNNSSDKQSKTVEETTQPIHTNSSLETVVKVEKDDTVLPCSQSESVGSKSNVIESKPVLQTVQNEKPKKTDTASQCDPRPRKGENKLTNNNSVHSKTSSKQAKHAKIQNATDSNVTKTAKDDKSTNDTDKRIKTLVESDKKILNNLKPTEKNAVTEKVLKSSPQKSEKTNCPPISEKISQKSESNKDSTRVQKPPVPQINGLCSAGELEKDKLSAPSKTNSDK